MKRIRIRDVKHKWSELFHIFCPVESMFYSKRRNEMRRIIILDEFVCERVGVFSLRHTQCLHLWQWLECQSGGGIPSFFFLMVVWTWCLAVRSERAGHHGWQEKPVDSSQIKPLCRFLLLFLPHSRPAVREKLKGEITVDLICNLSWRVIAGEENYHRML